MPAQSLAQASTRAISSPQADFTAATPSHRRLAFLDAVRGIAAFAVLLQHIASQQSSRFEADARIWFNFGQFGVVAFFLVSGFIIPVTLEKYGSLGRFWRARFFRLYPLYWVSLLLMLLLGWTHCAELQPAFYLHPARTIAANFTMLQRFIGLPDAEGVYWTLALELVFYALCSLLVLRRWTKRAIPVALVAALSVAIANNFCAFGLHRSPLAMHLALVVTAFIGAVVYRAYRGEAPLSSLYLVLPVALIVFIDGFWLHYVRFPEPGKLANSMASMLGAWIAGYALFFVLFALRDRCFPEWLQWLGRISYSVYLLHIIVFALIPRSADPFVWDPLAVILCLGLSHLTYRYIERPAIKFGR